jgi:hypothetical protein
VEEGWISRHCRPGSRALIAGLGREKDRWLKGDAPVYIWEWKEYRKVLIEATRTLEDVRKVLVMISSRVERDE